MYTQERYSTQKYLLNSELEQILKDSELEIKNRANLILLEMQSQAETAIQDVRQHISKLASS